MYIVSVVCLCLIQKSKKGGNGEYRTHDLKIMRLTLYRLSYVPVQRYTVRQGDALDIEKEDKKTSIAGIEPAILRSEV